MIIKLSFTQIIVRACSMFYPYEGYRSVTPLDAVRVNRTIFHNHSVHCDEIRLSVEFVAVGFLRICRHSCCD